MVAATWTRITGLSFVVQSLSKLLLTLKAMLGSANTFIMIIVGYLIVTATVFYILFKESAIVYINIIWTIRTMFDYMMGMYEYDVEKSYLTIHTIII